MRPYQVFYNCLLLCFSLSSAFVVKNTNMDDTHYFKGEVKSANAIAVKTGHDATTQQLVNFGSEVKKGDPLFTVKSDEQNAELIASIYAYFQSDMQMQIQTNALNADHSLHQMQALSDEKWQQTQIEYSEKSVQWFEKKQKLESKLAPYRLKVDDISHLAFMNITEIESFAKKELHAYVLAPRDGLFTNHIVSEKNDGKAEHVTLGSIIPAQVTEIEVQVDEYIIDRIQVGQKASLKIDPTSEAIDATVKMVMPHPISNSNPARYSVIVQPTDSTVKITAGKHIQVSINIPQTAGLLIPIHSTIRLDGQDMVKVINNGVATLVPVKLGKTSKHHIEVIEGLNEGDEIVEHN